MTQLVRITPEKQAAMTDELSKAIVAVLEAFSNKHRISPISSSALAMQCLTVGMQYMGGPASKPYVRAASEAMFCTDLRELRKIDARMENYMVSMGKHSDMLGMETKGGVQ